jgi:hypothetical protein
MQEEVYGERLNEPIKRQKASYKNKRLLCQ